MNELDLIKLNIYEAYDNGEITYGEKEYLLEQVEYIYEDAYSRKRNRLDKEIGNEFEKKDKKNLHAAQRLSKQMKDRGLDSRYSINNAKYKDHTFVDDPVANYKYYPYQHNSFAYFKGNHVSGKENYDSFVANRKKLQQTNDKLAHKAPGSVLDKQNAKKQKAAVNKSIQRRLEASKRKPIDNRLAKESTFDTLLESINDLYDED